MSTCNPRVKLSPFTGGLNCNQWKSVYSTGGLFIVWSNPSSQPPAVKPGSKPGNKQPPQQPPAVKPGSRCFAVLYTPITLVIAWMKVNRMWKLGYSINRVVCPLALFSSVASRAFCRASGFSESGIARKLILTDFTPFFPGLLHSLTLFDCSVPCHLWPIPKSLFFSGGFKKVNTVFYVLRVVPFSLTFSRSQKVLFTFQE